MNVSILVPHIVPPWRPGLKGIELRNTPARGVVYLIEHTNLYDFSPDRCFSRVYSIGTEPGYYDRIRTVEFSSCRIRITKGYQYVKPGNVVVRVTKDDKFLTLEFSLDVRTVHSSGSFFAREIFERYLRYLPDDPDFGTHTIPNAEEYVRRYVEQTFKAKR